MSNQDPIVIVGAARTPMGAFQGDFANVTASDLGAAILVHPWDMMGAESMPKYWLPWLVGMPAEQSRAACCLVFGGVLERLGRREDAVKVMESILSTP